MRSVIVLSSLALLVGLTFSPVIARTPQPLAFQLEPNNIPAFSYETWSEVQNSPAGSDVPKKTDLPETKSAASPSVSLDISRDLSEAFQRSSPMLSLVRNVVKAFASLGSATSSFAWYNHPVPPVDCSKYTIWEILNWTLHNHPKEPSVVHHTLPLYRLAWLANLSHPIQEALSDPDADLTLFAPDDKALTPPSKRKHHPHHLAMTHGHAGPAHELQELDAGHPFWDALDAIEGHSHCPHMRTAEFFGDGQDEDSKKKKILYIIEAVLKYHVSPGSKSIPEILDSSTLPTALKISPEPSASKFRVRVGAPPPFIKPGEVALNFMTRIDTLHTRPIRTKNGIIYIAHHVPLLPPLSPLSQLFLFPRPFSTATTALQKVHLDELLLPSRGNNTIPFGLGAASNDNDLSMDDDMDLDSVDERVQSVLSSLSGEEQGKLHKRSFTVFAPTNRAFRSLGPHVNAFLFSPFGAHILRYVLSYHVVPDVIWHTDYTKNFTEIQSMVTHYDTETDFPEELDESAFLHAKHHHANFRPHLPLPPIGKVNITELALPTLLGSRKNESLSLSVVEFRHLGKGPISRRVYIKQDLPSQPGKSLIKPPHKHAIPVIIPDAVAWGGAIHVIPKLIRPPIPEAHKHRKDVARAVELSILSTDEDEE